MHNKASSSDILRALRVQLVDAGDGVIVKRGRVETKIVGEEAVAIVQTLLIAAGGEGATVSDICNQFPAPERSIVETLIGELKSRRILVPVDASGPRPPTAEDGLDVFYWHFGESAAAVRERLASCGLAIVGVNHVSRRLASALAEAGTNNIEIVDYPLLCNLRMFDARGDILVEEWPAPLAPPLSYDRWAAEVEVEKLGCLIATSDFGGLQLMRRWNEFCVKHRIHFFPIVLQDLIGFVGPLVVPGETACFECLRARQNSHLTDPRTHRLTESVAFEGQAIAGFHPSMASILGDIAAMELARFYGGWSAPRSIGTLIEVNLLATEVRPRKVLKIPRCRVCSSVNKRSSTTLDKNTFMPGHALVR